MSRLQSFLSSQIGSRVSVAAAAILILAIAGSSCGVAADSSADGHSSSSGAEASALSGASRNDELMPDYSSATTAPSPETTTVKPTTPQSDTSQTVTTTGSAAEAVPRTGAGVLVDEGFERFAGLRVGLIVNQTSVVDATHLVDLVDREADIELGAIFSPEHGFRGTADAGELVEDSIDSYTGVPLYSLYGDTKQPTDVMVSDLDAIFYDLQDVGTRHYTYISTMGLAMQTAARNNVTFVILDRPNPLGGEYLAGPVLEQSQLSFIGKYPIPSVYAMTAGELALAIKGEAWLDGLEGLDLQVVEMQHWSRDTSWPDTGLEWVPPSPGLQTFAAALAYPGTVLFESTALSYGAGTEFAFSQIAASWIDADALVDSMNGVGLAGVRFESTSFTPQVIPGVAASPKLEGIQVHGIRLIGMDLEQGFDPFATGMHLLRAVQDQADQRGLGPIVERSAIFGLLTGSPSLLGQFNKGTQVQELLDQMAADITEFEVVRQRYLLYSIVE